MEGAAGDLLIVCGNINQKRQGDRIVMLESPVRVLTKQS